MPNCPNPSHLTVVFLLLLTFGLGCSACSGNQAITEKESAIIAENQRPGTTDWQLTTVHTERCSMIVLPDEPWIERTYYHTREIEGYCSQTSLAAGDTLRVSVSTDPVSEFSLDIYRMGYYGGKGGRLMKSLGPFTGTVQPVPPDGEKNLRECNWEESLRIAIPEDWLSGVYLGKLTAAQGGWQSYVIFIVKDDRPADLLFQCSDMTWQAYNRWPEWRSLYDWTADWGPTPWYTGVGPEVSFDRPYTFYMNSLPVGLQPMINGSGEFLLWEFPLAFWLEKEGYDVSYISNLDTHNDREGLLRAKGFLSVGHDEYWTQEMLENVSYARDQGVNLLFLSGNSVSGKIYLNPSSTGQADRVFGRIQFFDEEAELMGAKSYGVGLAPWTCVLPEHWIYEGTGLQKGDTIPDLIGWEYHGYPLGEISGLQVLAEGSLAGADSVRRYAATYYETPKGNFVFNAATCWWSMALSTPPGFPHPINPNRLFTDRTVDFRNNEERVQRMTANLLNRVLWEKPQPE